MNLFCILIYVCSLAVCFSGYVLFVPGLMADDIKAGERPGVVLRVVITLFFACFTPVANTVIAAYLISGLFETKDI